MVRLYYPRRQVLGLENLPPHGPVVLVANHPNGLLDPLVMWLALGREARSLAKSTFFRNPIGRLAMSCFESIPVHRAQDAATTADPARNDASVETARAVPAKGKWLALFPEGTSRSGPEEPLPVVIVPVGLAYESKSVFRSAVQLVVGRPISAVDDLAERQRNQRAAAKSLTKEIRAALDAVVLQAETTDLLEGISPSRLGPQKIRMRLPTRPSGGGVHGN